MLDYSNEYGFSYARKLFAEFLASDYCDIKSDSIRLTESEFKDLLKTKEFKEYLVTREKDYVYTSNILCEMSYDCDYGFGNLLEINPGKYELMSNSGDFYLTESKYLTKYYDPTFYYHDEDIIGGSVSNVKVIIDSNTLYRPVVQTYNKNDKLSLNDFDTFIYLNDIDIKTMLSLLRYSIENGKDIITGYVTNIFDKNVYDKISSMEEVYKRLNDKINDTYGLIREEECGSVIRLIHTLK